MTRYYRKYRVILSGGGGKYPHPGSKWSSTPLAAIPDFYRDVLSPLREFCTLTLLPAATIKGLQLINIIKSAKQGQDHPPVYKSKRPRLLGSLGLF